MAATPMAEDGKVDRRVSGNPMLLWGQHELEA